MTLSSALRTAIGIGGDISRTVSLALGGLIVVLAVAVAVTRNPATTLAETVVALVGVAFLCVLGGLAVVAVFAIVRLYRNPADALWRAAGLQAASGIATLALTFTLFGISIGIGSLAEQPLTPETVRVVIADLTGQFSLAFMTTVIGLPVSAVLRATLMVLAARGERTERHETAEVPS